MDFMHALLVKSGLFLVPSACLIRHDADEAWSTVPSVLFKIRAMEHYEYLDLPIGCDF